CIDGGGLDVLYKDIAFADSFIQISPRAAIHRKLRISRRGDVASVPDNVPGARRDVICILRLIGKRSTVHIWFRSVSIARIKIPAGPVVVTEYLIHGNPAVTGKIQLLMTGEDQHRGNKRYQYFTISIHI